MNSNASDLQIAFSPNSTLNDLAVLYLDTRSGGFTDATMNDTGDPGRNVVTNLGSAGNDGFPFEADFAIVFAQFGCILFELNGGSLNFISTTGAGCGGTGTNLRETAIPLSTLGVAPGGTIEFFMAYCSDTNFNSNETVPPIAAINGAGNPGNTATVNYNQVHRFRVQCDLPTVDVADAASPVCADETITVSATADNYTSVLWSAPYGSFGNPTALTTTYSGGSGPTTLTLTVTNVCGSVQDSTTVDFVQPPTVSTNFDRTTCSDTPITCNSSVNNAVSTLWTTSGDGTFGDATAQNTTYTPGPNDAGVIVITQTATANAPCGDVSASFDLTVTRAPTADAGPPTEIACELVALSLTGSVAHAGSVLWTTPDGTGTFADPNSAATTYTPSSADALDGSIELVLTATGSGDCSSSTASDSIALTVIRRPSVDIVSPPEPIIECELVALSLQSVASNSTGVQWTTDGTGTFNFDNIPNPTYTPSAADAVDGSVRLTVTAQGNAPCAPATDFVDVTVVRRPLVDAGPPTEIACELLALSLTGSVQHASGSTWSTSGSGTFADPFNPVTTYTPSSADAIAGTVTLTLTATANAPCANDADSIVVSVTPYPQVTITTPASYVSWHCDRDPIPVAGSVSNAASVQWWTSGTGVFTDPFNPVTTYTPSAGDVALGSIVIRLWADGNAPCSPNLDQRVFEFVARPADPTGATASPNPACIGQSLQLAVDASAYDIDWYAGTCGGTYLGTGNPFMTTATTSQTYYARARHPSVACESAGCASVAVVVNPAPTASAGLDIIECELVALQLQGLGSNGTPHWSGGLGSFSPDADRYNPVYVPALGEIGTTVTLTLTVSGPCGSAADTVDVTIRDATTWYADVDGDTYGDPNSTQEACDQPSGYVAQVGDCDDGNAEINPGATEVCNGVDDDCDTFVDEGVTNTYYRDADGDTYGDPNSTREACDQPSGYVAQAGDCDDGNAAINPGATEVCNGVDDDCDTVVDEGCGNQPPVAVPGGPYAAECDAAPDGHTDIPLDGSGSFDPNGGDVLTYAWTTDCPGATILNATSASATLRLTGCSASCHVTLTVDDGHGGVTAAIADVTLTDSAAPSVTAPADVSVHADAGSCAAVLAVGTASASDACDASPTVTGVRSDSLPLGDPYPTGVTTITWTAADDCGNTSLPALQTVTVSDQNEVELTVELAGAGPGAFARCMEVTLHRCGSPPVQRLVPVGGSSGTGSAVLTVPCGAYECVTVRDPLHTLRRTIAPLPTSGGRFQVAATGAQALQGGNLNGDFWIDILDFGAFVGQYGTNYGSPDTPCGTPPMHADFDCDGDADTADFTFIATGFLDGSDGNCCGLPGFAGRGPIAEIAVDKLHALGLSNLAIGDLNADGVLNADDMIAWMQGARPLPPPPADPADLGDQQPADVRPAPAFDLRSGGR